MSPPTVNIPAGLPESTRVMARCCSAGFISKVNLVEVLPNFDIWKNFNSIRSSVEVRRTSTEVLGSVVLYGRDSLATNEADLTQ